MHLEIYYFQRPRTTIMLPVLAFWSVLATIPACRADDLGPKASDFFNIDEETCSDHDINAMYGETVKLAESCLEDFDMLLNVDIGIDTDQVSTSNVVWNTRHALGTADLNKAARPVPPKTLNYEPNDLNKLKKAHRNLKDIYSFLGTPGESKPDLLCSERAFKEVTIAAIIDLERPMVLTVSGACRCSLWLPRRKAV